MNHLVKGDKIIDALKEIVPDVNIEDLDIPFRAVATDFYTGEEVIFDRGEAFPGHPRINIHPSLFRPVKAHARLSTGNRQHHAAEQGAENPVTSS